MMNNQLTQLLRDLPRLWRELDRTRQLAIGIGAAAVAMVLVVGGGMLLTTSRPQYDVLFSDLQDSDAAAVVQKLREAKVPYELTDGGSTVRVPSSRKHEVRLQLASAGLPSGGRVGFEIFDRTQLGVTDFVLRLNRQRALEGELQRTIQSLAPVEQARVHLSVPEERLFTQQQRDPTASVTIKLRPGRTVTPQQVSSIEHLVASAVPGLKRDGVTVVDSVSGVTLESQGTGDAAQDKLAATRQQAQAEQERALERRLTGMLEQALGPNKVAVKANVVLEWDQKETTSEQFSQPVARSTRDTREQFRGTGVEVPPPVGPPGTQANIPSYPAGAPTGPSEYSRSDVTTNNEISKVQEKTQRAQGVPRETRVAVMVDQQALARAAAGDAAAKVAELRGMVATAAGTAEANVSMVPVAFDDSRQRAEQMEQQTILAIKVGALLLALLGLFVIFRFLVHSVRREQPALAGAEPGALPAGEAIAALPAPSQEELEAEILARLAERERELLPQLEYQLRPELEQQLRPEIEAEIRQLLEEERLQEEERRRMEEEASAVAGEAAARRQRVLRNQVIELARRNPETIAGVLREWMIEEAELPK